jgi:Fic family protein
MIKRPPKDFSFSPLSHIAKALPQQLHEYLELYKPIDAKGRYLPFDEVRFRIDKDLDLKLAWAVIKSARRMQLSPVIPLGEPIVMCNYYLTPTIQKAISDTDRNTTTAALELMCSKVGENSHLDYLLNDLIEDEAISSSQLEGAATTTKIAKDLLKRKRKPRTSDEKMILGNYKMMKYAWKNRNKALSVDLILALHKEGVEGINDDLYYPGILRDVDDVIVVDGEGETVHTPPPSKGLALRLDNLCSWVNACHDDIESNEYFHPLIKALSLHFAIGFEHPFRDGNGRVARSLFYWYMFKNDFSAFKYISISVLLKDAPVKYGKSYLYTETDEMDLTYFIDYQCTLVLRAIREFRNAYQQNLKAIEDFNRWLWESGLYKKLNDKQRTVFQVAKDGMAKLFTVTNVKENLGCSYNTASSVLNGLVELQLFTKKKTGREWVYSLLSKDEIVHSWGE